MFQQYNLVEGMLALRVRYSPSPLIFDLYVLLYLHIIKTKCPSRFYDCEVSRGKDILNGVRFLRK